LFDVVRGPGKKFSQRHWDPDTEDWIWNVQDVRRVPYRLPELVEAVAAGETVFVVEGEKDADRLAREGLVATTNPSGAGQWKNEYSTYLAGARVVIIPDNDQPGQDHADKVLDSVSGAASSAAIVTLPDLADKGDVSDWLNNGYTVSELVELADRALEEPLSGLPVLTLSDLADLPRTEYLIDGFVQKRGINLLIGDSGAGKTFVALDMCLAVATDTPWHGRTVEPGKVLYVCGEGITGIYDRVEAWQTAHGAAVPDDRIVFLDRQLNLMNRHDVAQITRTAVRVDADVVVIDPLARLMYDAEENSARDMGTAVAAIEQIRRSTDGTVLAVHHKGKGASRGERGSSALRAAADQSIWLSRTGQTLSVIVSKSRDSESGTGVHLRLRQVGASAVLADLDVPHGGTPELTPQRQRVLDALAEAGSEGLTAAAWRTACESDIARSSFYNTRTWLMEHALVSGTGDEDDPHRPADKDRRDPEPVQTGLDSIDT
jgi:hypothetical protein